MTISRWSTRLPSQINSQYAQDQVVGLGLDILAHVEVRNNNQTRLERSGIRKEFGALFESLGGVVSGAQILDEQVGRTWSGRDSHDHSCRCHAMGCEWSDHYY